MYSYIFSLYIYFKFQALQYQNNFNFVNQNLGINLPSDPIIRRPDPVLNLIPMPQVSTCLFLKFLCFK